MFREVDYLIIGHGLAGATLANKLLQRNVSVMVLDAQDPNSASRVAAGIINPVTGHRLNLSAGFADFFPAALRTFREFEAQFQHPVFTELKKYRLIKNAGENTYYLQRSQRAEYQDILGGHANKLMEFKPNDFGCVEVLQSGVVNVAALLKSSEHHLRATDAFRHSQIDYQRLDIQATGVIYDDIKANNVLFCEGSKALQNPWLTHLPFKLSKGEIVELDVRGQPSVPFLNWGKWLIPTVKEHQALLGSTYEWSDLSLNHIQTNKLLQSLQKHTTIKAQAINTRAGIRPTTIDRVPFIGKISELPNAYCFNGFGSKGCLLIPSYAERMCDFLLRGKRLPDEVQKWL